MPTIVGGGKLRDPRRRTMRNSVSLLTSTLSRREREAAGLPPSAMARQWTTSSRRLVRLALGSAVSNRSAKIRRSQAAMSQKKRRVRKISAIRTPAAGRSANRLRYWLCTRLQTLPHIGHRQTLAETLIPITKPPSSLVALSTTNPRGTSSATSNPCIALIPSPNQSQTGASTSSKVSQPPYSAQIWGPVSVIIDRYFDTEGTVRRRRRYDDAARIPLQEIGMSVDGLIPKLVDHDPWAQSRRPMDMIRQG